ncbi:ATP-binding protein [Proteiniclasticum sp. SCR006]|uniref:histidine kinase n=1 Tax=Proteiniclasticum aestuarii TaxID=2817862 RepID=A0A939HDI2_9CLOT|nr:ATP-binding protein [Proteiniclasticum aestuarii]MBO1265565.1 ATP-binding protein [Proteiniclasticum aestuarii]
MMRIGEKLGRYFSLVSLSSVLLITVLSNIGMNVFFTTYLRSSQESDDQAIAEYTRELLTEEGSLDEQDLMSIEHYAFTMKAEVILENEEKEVILSTREPIEDMGNSKDTQNYMDPEKFSYREYTYGKDRTMYIGRSKSVFSASPDRKFLLTINFIYLLSAVISLIIGMLLRNRIKGIFLRPIYAIQDNARRIEEGEYQLVENVNTDTVELDELAGSIKKMALRLQNQEILRRRLTADIAHELRTPLSTVNSHLEAFIDGVWEPTPERLVLLQDEIRRLTSLIRDLGDLSYMESGEIRLAMSKVNLTELITNIMDGFEPLFLSDGKILLDDLAKDVFVYGDSDRLNQVLVNILSNALKYTDEGDSVEVVLREKKKTAEIIIKDNGIGIEKKDIPYVFERFYRSDLSRNRSTGGKGIGLTITRSLVEAHQGTIEVESESGKGTTMTIILPLYTAPE